MQIATIVLFALAVPVAVWAYRSDNREWASKSKSELLAMVSSDDWRGWKLALQELRRRGDDISSFVPVMLQRLLTEETFARASAHITLIDLFPELRPRLKQYQPQDKIEVSREKIGPLLQEYPLVTNPEA